MAVGAPHTFSFAEFHQHTGGGQQAYTKYLRYVANFRANRLASQNANPLNADALAPIAPQAEIPKLHQMVSAEVNPLISTENKSYTGDVNAAKGALTGYSTALANFYQPQSQQIKDNTLAATGAMAAANGALGSQLAGGAAGQSDLAAYLGKAGGGAPLSAMSNFGTTGANLLAARGDAAINGAIGHGIAAANSAAYLPTFAAQTGQQTLGNTLNSLTRTHDKNIASLTAQEPGIFDKLYQSFVNNEIQKAIARNSGYVSQSRAATYAAGTTTRNANSNAGFYTDGQGRRVPKGYEYNPKGQLVKIPGQNAPASGPGSTRYKAYTTARSRAVSIVKSEIDKAIAPQTVTKTVSQPNPLDPGGQPITKQVKVKERQPNYNGTINRIIGLVQPLLAPYMGRTDIIRFVQQMVNNAYGAGQYGRPGSGSPTSENGSGFATHPRP